MPHYVGDGCRPTVITKRPSPAPPAAIAKPRHTPGAWDADSAPGVIQDGKGRILAMMQEDYDDNNGNPVAWPEGEQEANAALMAAAPDLLSACRLAIGSLRAAGFTNATVRAVEQAIAKAEAK